MSDPTNGRLSGARRINVHICGEFTQRLHEGTPADAICDTVRSVGQRLASVMPRAHDDVNELPDQLVVIE
ncbi:MAG: hypothetical protein WDZ59_05705 [Pirellulales bacterium]